MTRTNGAIDVDDQNAVEFAVRRLQHIANEIDAQKAATDLLFAERKWLVYQLRGHVSQQRLAQACGCGVDMIKNISASARREFDTL